MIITSASNPYEGCQTISFKDGGYMGLLVFEVRSWFGTFPLLVRAFGFPLELNR